MKEEFGKKLWEDYPDIFSKKITGHRVWMECGDGWYDHINTLCATVMLYCKDHNIEPPIASQVKEKYGSLRFYVWSAAIEVFDIIERFELESQYVCEVCGKRGKVRSVGGWYSCECEEHFANRRTRHAEAWKRSKGKGE